MKTPAPPRLLLLVALVATALLVTGCLGFTTARFRPEWGPKPVGPANACPALGGTYENAGEPAPYCEWIFPIPFPLGCSHEQDGVFHRSFADTLRIEMDDSENVRITVLQGERVIREQTLSRENDDFTCGDGRLRWVAKRTFEHSLVRELARASDGALLVLTIEDIMATGFASGYLIYYRYWSRHPERTLFPEPPADPQQPPSSHE